MVKRKIKKNRKKPTDIRESRMLDFIMTYGWGAILIGMVGLGLLAILLS